MTLNKITIWNRKKRIEENEPIYGIHFLKFTYKTSIGKLLLSYFLLTSLFSKLYGILQSSFLSSIKIKPFIKKYKINMGEYEDKTYLSFNDFFTRKFKEGSRLFDMNKAIMPAFCEGRYLAYESLKEDTFLPIKENFLDLKTLLGKEEWFNCFKAGPIFIARLCPTDYHRFHYPDAGKILDQYSLHGKLHSVNPVALERQKYILSQNERQVSILDCENFSRLAYIEVGALCVGKIIQTNKENYFHRAQEKGFFRFGASTVILVGERGAWIPDEDILERSKKKQECFISLGERIAIAKRA